MDGEHLMTEESVVTSDELTTLVQATPTSQLDGDSICDYDGARLNPCSRNTINGVTYEVRECSANPEHVKQITV
jgi:hypothetical protein